MTVPSWVVATAVAGTVLIALGAFWLSFTALADLAGRAGIPAGQAWVWPLIVDGIIVVATISVVALSPQGPRATWYPWSLLIVGAAVSVSGNAAHAILAADSTLPRVLAAAISSVPPLVLLAITHLTVKLTSHTRPKPTTNKAQDLDVPMVDEPGNAAGATPIDDRAERVRVAWARRRAGWSNKRIARHLGLHPSTIGRWFTQPPPAHDTATANNSDARSNDAPELMA